MKKILFSVVLLAVGIAFLIWFSKTDQGQAGLVLGLDAPEEQLAYGWPAFIGWVGVFSLVGAFALFCFGVSQIKQNKQEEYEQRCQNESDRWHKKRTASYMEGGSNEETRPKGFGRHENYNPCD